MINPNEFRLGNKVITYDENWQEMEATITLLYEGHYCVMEHNSAMLWEHLKPIPLTEEELLRMGGKKALAVLNGSQTKEAIFILNMCLLNIGGEWIDYNTRTKLPYVHKLQNFIFALTGEELVRKCDLTTDETPIK